MLKIAGDLYLPFLAANAEAFAKGLERLEINVWGLPYALAPFKYQVKCLQSLREKFAALDPKERKALRPVLEGQAAGNISSRNRSAPWPRSFASMFDGEQNPGPLCIRGGGPQCRW